jgi:hypothetical protein
MYLLLDETLDITNMSQLFTCLCVFVKMEKCKNDFMLLLVLALVELLMCIHVVQVTEG